MGPLELLASRGNYKPRQIMGGTTNTELILADGRQGLSSITVLVKFKSGVYKLLFA